jgi:hypothetical protein
MLEKLIKRYHHWKYQRILAQQNFQAKTVSEIFTETYQNRYWKSKETVSGMGSEMGQTTTLRAELPLLFQQFGIKSLLDLPCGDFNWMQQVDLQGIEYTGGDIVEALISQNQLKYGNAHRSFRCLDILTDTLPDADCIMVRDCLVHFSLAHIEQALANLRKSNFRYLLTTSFPNLEQNEDIQTGYWRPINLQKAPFNFPEPLARLMDAGKISSGAFADKSLFLWELKR